MDRIIQCPNKLRFSFFSVTFFLVFIAFLIISCEDFIEIDPPKTELISETVFSSDATASAAILAIYSSMSNGGGFSGGSFNSVTYLIGHSSDEFMYLSTDQNIQQINQNNMLSSNNYVSSIWSDCYNLIYQANAIIEGVSNSSGVSEGMKKQLEGEAKFIRAFCHFHLLNLFGDIPYVTTTNYIVNNVASRKSVEEVYSDILNDLFDAKNLLSSDYNYSNGEKVRPNKWVATAFLSRVYLYTREWAKAEEQASLIIDNTSLFSFNSPDEVFLKNSDEAIWQLIPNNSSFNTFEGNIFILTTSPSNSVLTPGLVNAFEEGDIRKDKWVDSLIVNSTTWYYPYKYKINTGRNPFNEYSMVMRLAEQCLIRAEARAQQNKLSEAISDIDIIRGRGGLPLISNVNPSISKDELLWAIQKERRVELFSEWGHRWFDLKRTGHVDEVLGTSKPAWVSSDALLPIPNSEILVNRFMIQNPGY